ncbi:DUF2147 domain-containing protein [Novosphingobium aquae]|uniref:DUF2147 domain-containing protein n=1 Tax=Novosphingobium aquae TaxID=3133435 RepID=A0ABU8SAC9_9SPHN
MPSRKLMSLLMIAGFLVTSQAATAQKATGLWRTPAMGGATLSLEKCGPDLCARIVKIDGETPQKPRLDENNPDPARRGDRLVGKYFITGLKGGPTKWSKGKIYHPPTGKKVEGSLRLIDSRTIEVKACMFMMCRTSKLVRLG